MTASPNTSDGNGNAVNESVDVNGEQVRNTGEATPIDASDVAPALDVEPGSASTTDRRVEHHVRRRDRISTRLYAGIGLLAVLTLVANIIAWNSFNDVADVQTQINEGSVPNMASAFAVAQFSGIFGAAAPQIVAAAPQELPTVTAIIDTTYAVLQQNLDELSRTDLDPEEQQIIRGLTDQLVANLDEVTSARIELFALANRREALQTELQSVQNDFDDVVVGAIDDQFFYTMTGFRDIAGIQAARNQHLSEREFLSYRYLTELQSDTSIATQLLASAFTVSDAAQIEPLRERFESVNSRIERSLSGLGGSSVLFFLTPVLERLSALGTADGAFDLKANELGLIERQEELLRLNDEITLDVVEHVNSLVREAEASVAVATDNAERAILGGRTLLLAVSAAGLSGAALIMYGISRILMRRINRLSSWMRRMAKGDLEATTEVGGRDEVADMANALEVFRQHALELQRLNLVEMLAEELKEKNEQLEEVLADLNKAQDQIVMREKLAALGELTAGVAHEIRNPLNFVKNFSEVSQELLDELKEIIEDISDDISDDNRTYVEEVIGDLTGNLERILSHGGRANRIVQDMLMMGRDVGEWQFTDINQLLDEHSRLAYHAARAQDPNFNLTLNFDPDPEVGMLEVIPRDLSRVFLNMVSNACDATDDKRRTLQDEAEESGVKSNYEPNLWMTTTRQDEHIEVRIRDNGKGIPPEVRDKMFNPFFTTKPTDRGTGLGLAISNDIVRQHGGTIQVESEPGEWTEMIVTLPLERPNSGLEATGDSN